MTTTDRTTAAEARFVEEGHRAFVDHDEAGPHIRVVSETLGHRGIAYKVRAVTAGPGCPILFTCTPDGPVGADGHPELSSVDGRPPCKHAAGAARRLGREGYAVAVLPGIHGDIVTRDTRWVATEATGTGPGSLIVSAVARAAAVLDDAMTAAAEGKDGDPFAGFA